MCLKTKNCCLKTFVEIRMGKEFGKELIFLSKRKFHEYLVGWPFSRSTHKMTGWNDDLPCQIIINIKKFS